MNNNDTDLPLRPRLKPHALLEHFAEIHNPISMGRLREAIIDREYLRQSRARLQWMKGEGG